MILRLMTLAGTTNRTLIEISSQDGRVCMGTNLVILHRWRGFLFDGDPSHVREDRKFFAGQRATASDPPVMEARWFTRSNIDAVPHDVAVTVPYADAFDFRRQAHPLYRSASLTAYVAMYRAEGYRLVGMNALGFDADFLRDDALAGTILEIPASALATNDFARRVRTQYWSDLSTLPWVPPPDAAAPRIRRRHSVPRSESRRGNRPDDKTFSAFPF